MKIEPVVVGIDIGVHGAIAVMGVMGVPIKIYSMPIIEIDVAGKRKDGSSKVRNIYDEKKIKKLFFRLKRIYYIEQVCIERPVLIPGKSGFVSGAFEGFGYLKGVLSGLNIKYSTIMPSMWIKDILGVMRKRKNNENLGVYSKIKKARSIKMVKKKYPAINIKDHDGFADALLIAEWVNKMEIRY